MAQDRPAAPCAPHAGRAKTRRLDEALMMQIDASIMQNDKQAPEGPGPGRGKVKVKLQAWAATGCCN